MLKSRKGLSVGAMFAIGIGIAVAVWVGMQNHAHAATPYPDAATARFSVTVTGTGPDVLLIPGLGSSAATWDGTVAKLSGQYRLHVLNLSGFAGEPAATNAKGDILPAEVAAIDAYIEANHLKSPAVVGHSLGGLLGLMLAKAHPEDTGKLVIVDALPYVGVIFNPSATVAALTPIAAGMRDGFEKAPADAFAAQEAQSTAGLVTGPENRKMVLAWAMTSDRHVLAQAFYEDLSTDLRPDMKTLKTPVTVLYAVATGEDKAQTEAIYRMNYAGANATFVPVTDSRHFEMLDQPEAFNTALAAALK